jgi:hypothetical protein
MTGHPHQDASSSAMRDHSLGLVKNKTLSFSPQQKRSFSAGGEAAKEATCIR